MKLSDLPKVNELRKRLDDIECRIESTAKGHGTGARIYFNGSVDDYFMNCKTVRDAIISELKILRVNIMTELSALGVDIAA